MQPDFLTSAAALTPNALLVIAAIDATALTGQASPKSDDIGWVLGTNSPWLRRHGKAAENTGFCSMSMNGHCSVSREGRNLAALLRTSVPTVEPRSGCEWCGKKAVGAPHFGRQLYTCGRVAQWCPDRVPGHEPAEISPRSRKAQHTGRWFNVTPCGGLVYRGRDKLIPSLTSDKRELVPGSQVVVNHGSPAKGWMGNLTGTVYAASNGTVLIDWEPSERSGEVFADVMLASSLATPGVPDATGLSDYQQSLLEAYRNHEVTILLEDGKAAAPGRFNPRPPTDKQKEAMRATGIVIPRAVIEGRPIGRRAVEILVERGLIAEYAAA